MDEDEKQIFYKSEKCEHETIRLIPDAWNLSSIFDSLYFNWGWDMKIRIFFCESCGLIRIIAVEKVIK
jgi:hypothetical protein